ncbi:mannose-1-phosphate guanylyltransferase/mannose-6-phosphate isomerase [Pseudazoarcus pumilus]|uniref:mannose-1-phosphate guanylyltransferase n=1 Tax=Pseudazoarcus pumilus TaxID=2067960 RepID=A0A2I6S8Z7_9RHOO|nr:mannose-1-phosphate guanylyltransferase/mannose-6-phosphate isomerase [Pseudazoarcus pumilus]AUN95733.1 mannose-1-phosphate guanylyltransferase/mannose-6-phosphate isomerase [Pseudazoarcus pumilus]
MPVFSDKPSIQPVLLCGGAGTRLWPLSRADYPKQFLAFGSAHTMLQQTMLRTHGLERLGDVRDPVVVCQAAHRFIAAQQLAEVGVRQAALVLEPAGRNTAPALTLAALQAVADGADPVLLAMPADHLMRDVAAFHAAVEHGFADACAGAMITFGITPRHAETGYGYIRADAAGSAPVRDVLAFVEKPDAATAQAYVESGDYLWNSGIFMVRASRWLAAIERFRPDIHTACARALDLAARDADFIRPDATAFEACPGDSIDYAVMERLPDDSTLGMRARVVAMDAGWSDVGSWDALWAELDHDPDGNATTGDCVLSGVRDTLVHAEAGRLVAVVGVSGLVVVATPDAVLVADRRNAQQVKQLVEQLRGARRDITANHRKVHRPWGWYDSVDAGERFQVKRIVVNPGASLSLQMHHHRAEHWVVVRGTAQVTRGDDTFLLAENESTFIPVGEKHRLLNPGKVPLEIVEVQSGGYLGEDDIVRFDDCYGR